MGTYTAVWLLHTWCTSCKPRWHRVQCTLCIPISLHTAVSHCPPHAFLTWLSPLLPCETLMLPGVYGASVGGGPIVGQESGQPHWPCLESHCRSHFYFASIALTSLFQGLRLVPMGSKELTIWSHFIVSQER